MFLQCIARLSLFRRIPASQYHCRTGRLCPSAAERAVSSCPLAHSPQYRSSCHNSGTFYALLLYVYSFLSTPISAHPAGEIATPSPNPEQPLHINLAISISHNVHHFNARILRCAFLHTLMFKRSSNTRRIQSGQPNFRLYQQHRIPTKPTAQFCPHQQAPIPSGEVTFPLQNSRFI